MNGQPWTEAEIAHLQARYASDGGKACATALGRSPHAVAVKAAALGLATRKQPWTAAHDRLIRLHYAENGPVRIAAMIPGRSAIEVRRRAAVLKASSNADRAVRARAQDAVGAKLIADLQAQLAHARQTELRLSRELDAARAAVRAIAAIANGAA